MSQSGKKKLRIHKYPDTRGRGLRIRTILPPPLLDYRTAIYICNKTNIYGLLTKREVKMINLKNETSKRTNFAQLNSSGLEICAL